MEPIKAPLVWGKLLDRWLDEGRVFHALRPDGSPACGVAHYTSAGEYPNGPTTEYACCRRCLRVKGAPPLHVVNHGNPFPGIPKRAAPLPPGEGAP